MVVFASWILLMVVFAPDPYYNGCFCSWLRINYCSLHSPTHHLAQELLGLRSQLAATQEQLDITQAALTTAAVTVRYGQYILILIIL